MMVLVVEDKRITCHKAILSFHSSFMDAACNGGFAESQNSEILLLEEQASLLKLFVGWLYTGLMVGEPGGGVRVDMLMVDLWLLGDRMGCPAFQNEVMGLMFAFYEFEAVSSKVIRLAYDNTVNGSVLRKCIRDLALRDKLLTRLDLEEDMEVDDGKWNGWDKGWIVVLGEGGDFVKDYFIHQSTFGKESADFYEHGEENGRYFVQVPDRPVENFIKDFLAGKTRLRNGN